MGILNVETNGAYLDDEQAYASGVVEGWLTATDIETTFFNLAPVVFGNKTQSPTKQTQEFLDDQEKYWYEAVKGIQMTLFGAKLVISTSSTKVWHMVTVLPVMRMDLAPKIYQALPFKC